jgi:hypothetical protein
MNPKWRLPHSRKIGGASIDRTRRYLLGTALGLVLTADETPTAKRRVQIAAGPASATLGELMRQTRLQLLFESDAVWNHRTRAVKGQLDVVEALAGMLEGSGLTFEFINKRTAAVRAASLPPPAPGDGMTYESVPPL